MVYAAWTKNHVKWMSHIKMINNDNTNNDNDNNNNNGQ